LRKINFQAKATLQSIIENYEPNDAIKQAAIDRMKQLIDEEEKLKTQTNTSGRKRSSTQLIVH
jgi:hypothetical protein